MGWTPKFRRIDQEPEVRTGVMSSGWAVGMTSPRAAAPDVVLLRGNRKCSRGGFPLSLQVLARQADVQPSIFLGTSPWRSERTGLVHACRHGGLPLAPFDGLEPFARPANCDAVKRTVSVNAAITAAGVVRLPSSRQEFAFGLASRAFPVHGQAVPLRQISFRCPCGIGVNGRDPAFPSDIPSRSTRKRFQGQRRSRLVVPGKMHKLTEEAVGPC